MRGALASQHQRERPGQDGERQRQRQPEQQGEPERLHADVGRARLVPRAAGARQAGGGAVGQEAAQRGDEEQDGRRQGEPGERVRPQAADDGGVGDEVERLRGQGAEGRERERGDPAVERAPEEVGPVQATSERPVAPATSISSRSAIVTAQSWASGGRSASEPAMADTAG